MNVYPTATTHCAACGARVKTVRTVCLYLVGDRAALSYVLCKHCDVPVRQRKGLPEDVLAKVTAAMELEATAYGFNTTH